MTAHATARRAAGGLALAAVLAAAAPALAAGDDPDRLPGDRYLVVNQTGVPLACRFRVNEGGVGGSEITGWQDVAPIAAGGQFTHRATGPGESVTLDCNPASDRAKPFTVRPGQRYAAATGDDGKLAITPVRS